MNAWISVVVAAFSSCFVTSMAFAQLPSTRTQAMRNVLHNLSVDNFGEVTKSELETFQKCLKEVEKDERLLDFQQRKELRIEIEETWRQGLTKLTNPEVRILAEKGLERYKIMAVGPFEYLRHSGVSNLQNEITNEFKEEFDSAVAMLSKEIAIGIQNSVDDLPLHVRQKLGRRLGFSAESLSAFYSGARTPREVEQSIRVLGGVFADLPNVSFGNLERLLVILAESPQKVTDMGYRIGLAASGYAYHAKGSQAERERITDLIEKCSAKIPAKNSDCIKLLNSASGMLRSNEITFEATQIQYMRFGTTMPLENRFHVVEVQNYADNLVPVFRVGDVDRSIQVIRGKTQPKLDVSLLEFSESQTKQIFRHEEWEQRIESMEDTLLDSQAVAVFRSIVLPAGLMNVLSSNSVRSELDLENAEFETFLRTSIREHKRIVQLQHVLMKRAIRNALAKHPESVDFIEAKTGLKIEALGDSRVLRSPSEFLRLTNQFNSFYVEIPESVTRSYAPDPLR